MHIRKLNQFLAVLLLSLLALLVFTYKSPSLVLSATTHAVISEIQIEGGTASDEFVELYNPTDTVIDLTGWTLYRKTAALDAPETALATPSGSIPAHGFYLIAHQDFDGGVTPNTTYTGQNIADNNTLILRDGGSQIVDLVGMGTAATNETAAVQNPIDNRSIERKALTLSTADDMASAGAHVTFGNGKDTQHNANDFVRHVAPNVSDPQNSSSATETPAPDASASPSPAPTPSVGPSATPEPSVSPTPGPSASPDVSPTATPSPTVSPAASVSPTPTPTPTVSPSASPIVSPSASPVVSPSATPVSSPSATPAPSVTPTPSPSATPVATPVPTPSVSPTPSPSASPSVSPSPVATPLPSVSPSPVVSPSASPSVSPTPTPSATPVVSPSATPVSSPSASPTPTVSPSPRPTPSGNIIFSGILFTCRFEPRVISTRLFTVIIPRVRCTPNFQNF